MRLVSLTLMVFALAMLVLGVQRAVSPAQGEPLECITSMERDRVRSLTAAAIDEALQKHVINLFSVWLKDPTPEPTRAKVGMANGLSAFHRAQANAASWQPIVCKE